MKKPKKQMIFCFLCPHQKFTVWVPVSFLTVSKINAECFGLESVFTAISRRAGLAPFPLHQAPGFTLLPIVTRF